MRTQACGLGSERRGAGAALSPSCLPDVTVTLPEGAQPFKQPPGGRSNGCVAGGGAQGEGTARRRDRQEQGRGLRRWRCRAAAR